MAKEKIYRILDVNFNRAREGLRVVEEICRFVLEDKALTLALKTVRGNLLKAMKALEGPAGERRLKARRAKEDIGKRLYPKTEGQRLSLEDIFRANIKRTQEALRCLEEFSKLINPKLGKVFKGLRFRIYDLEKMIGLRLTAYGLRQKFDFGLYLVTDPLRDHVESIKQAIAGGIKIVQLRDKTITKSEYFRLAKKISQISKKAGVTFILNDYVDLVNKVGADGIHLGQDDLKLWPIEEVRRKLGKEKIIGVSTHSLKQALKAEKAGADYLSVGPIFSTPSKPETEPVGLKLLRQVVKRVKIPIVAIGGINEFNLNRIKNCGVSRFAMIRGILAAKNIRQKVIELSKIAGEDVFADNLENRL